MVSTEFYSAKGKNLQVILKDNNSQICPFQEEDLAECGPTISMWSLTE